LNKGVSDEALPEFKDWNYKAAIYPLFWGTKNANGDNLNKKGGVFDNFKACFDT